MWMFQPIWRRVCLHPSALMVTRRLLCLTFTTDIALLSSRISQSWRFPIEFDLAAYFDRGLIFSKVNIYIYNRFDLSHSTERVVFSFNIPLGCFTLKTLQITLFNKYQHDLHLYIVFNLVSVNWCAHTRYGP